MKNLTAFLIVISLILLQLVVFPQKQDSLLNEIGKLNDKVTLLEKKNSALINKLAGLNQKLESLNDSLNKKLKENSTEIENLEKQMSARIERTDSNATQKYFDLDSELAANTIYWIIGLLVLAVFSIIIYFLLKGRMSSQKDNLDQEILKTRKDLEEEGIKLDNKLMEILNSQMKVLQINKTSEGDGKDHSLALKVADEIVRIEKNLSNMDPGLKGHKQLEASVGRIRDNFQASGYEIVDMLNKPYDAGMKVVANFRPDETLKTGEQVITRIIKPQVNFKGEMIQSAQIEVSQGE